MNPRAGHGNTMVAVSRLVVRSESCPLWRAQSSCICRAPYAAASGSLGLDSVHRFLKPVRLNPELGDRRIELLWRVGKCIHVLFNILNHIDCGFHAQLVQLYAGALNLLANGLVTLKSRLEPINRLSACLRVEHSAHSRCVYGVVFLARLRDRRDASMVTKLCQIAFRGRALFRLLGAPKTVSVANSLPPRPTLNLRPSPCVRHTAYQISSGRPNVHPGRTPSPKPDPLAPPYPKKRHSPVPTIPRP